VQDRKPGLELTAMTGAVNPCVRVRGCGCRQVSTDAGDKSSGEMVISAGRHSLSCCRRPERLDLDEDDVKSSCRKQLRLLSMFVPIPVTPSLPHSLSLSLSLSLSYEKERKQPRDYHYHARKYATQSMVQSRARTSPQNLSHRTRPPTALARVPHNPRRRRILSATGHRRQPAMHTRSQETTGSILARVFFSPKCLDAISYPFLTQPHVRTGGDGQQDHVVFLVSSRWVNLPCWSLLHLVACLTFGTCRHSHVRYAHQQRKSSLASLSVSTRRYHQ
jgi:hypothetical protein